MSHVGKPGPGEPTEAFRHYSAKVSRQAIVFLVGTLFGAALGYLFRIWLGRVLGAEGLGVFTLGLRWVELCALATGLGLPVALARFVASYRETGQLGRIRSLLLSALGVSSLAALLLAVLVWVARRAVAEGLFDTPDLLAYLPLFALLIPVATLRELLGQTLRGHQEVWRRTVIRHFVRLPVTIAVTVALFAAGLELGAWVLGEVAGQVLAVALLGFYVARLTPGADEPAAAPGLDREVRAFAVSMLGLDVLRFLSARVDVVVLGILLGAEEVGVYAMAVATAAFVPILLRALNSIFGPIVSGLHTRGDQALLERLFHSSTKWCFALTLPLGLCIVLFAEPLMALFGAGFMIGAEALAFLVVGQLIHVGTGSVGNLLTMSGHQRAELWSVGLGAVSALGLQLMLMPRWGIDGAALALALALALANGLRLVMVRRLLGLWPYRRRSAWLLVAVMAGAGAAMAVRQLWPGEPSIVTFLVALAVSYPVLLTTSLPMVDEDDRRWLADMGQKARAWVGR